VKRRTVIHTIIMLAAAVLGTAVISGCTKPAVDRPDSGTAVSGPSGNDSGAGSSSGNSAGTPMASAVQSSEKSGEKTGKGRSMDGIWYEQSLDGSTITISGKTIVYKSGYSDYTDKSSFKTKGLGNTVSIVPEEELFAVIDIEYDKKVDTLTAHTYPHTDGDGGYHLLTYARTVFTPTPEPTYGAKKDLSDPDAFKETDSYEFTSLKMSFYDEGDTSYIGTDMAQQPPYSDYYEYELDVREDGSGVLSSDFCQTIPVGKDIVDETETLMQENDLASINGLDIHTEDIPYGFPTYSFELTLASGEKITSSADFKDVPENWSAFQHAAHLLLFEAFTDAGYNAMSGEFHTVEAMKRIGRGERADLGVIKDSAVILGKDMSYDYSLDAKYTVFEFGDETPSGLAKALTDYSDELKAAAEQDLKNDYELMESASRKEIKKADRLYAYSFRVAERFYGDDLLFFVFESEGHANSLGIGYSGYGLYPQHRYAFDTQTGERVYPADLFNDEDALLELVTETLCTRYGSKNADEIRSQKVQDLLRKGLKGEEGADPVDFDWSETGITFYIPVSTVYNDGYTMTCSLFYEDIQDDLSDRYTVVRRTGGLE